MTGSRPRPAVPRRLPPAAGAAHAHLDHAPGRALPSGIPARALTGRVRHTAAQPRAGRGSDPAAAAPLPAGCRHSLQRHHDAAAGNGRRSLLRARPCGARADPDRCRHRCARGARPGARRTFRARVDPAGARRAAARRAAHRLRRRPVHAALLSGLRAAVEGVRRRALVPLLEPRSRRSASSTGWRTPWPPTCVPRPPPARRR